MGTRVVFELQGLMRGVAKPMLILFSNYSHPEVDPVAVFETVVDNAQGITDVAETLLGMRYATAGGNHRAGDRMFSIVEEPYGDYEFIMRLRPDGEVDRIEGRA